MFRSVWQLFTLDTSPTGRPCRSGSPIVTVILALFIVSPAAMAVCRDGCDVALFNTFQGNAALVNNTTGNANTAFGAEALVTNHTGTASTAVGVNALHENNAGSNNTAVGTFALERNVDGNFNTATGYFALEANIGSQNTATGFFALGYNTTGNANTAGGYGSLLSNTTGAENTAHGFDALYTNTMGTDNTADGAYALYSNSSGNQNLASGVSALYNNKAGHDNTAAGFQALGGNTTGINNVALGSNAGLNLTTGSNNIVIGANVPGVAAEANTIRIGKQGTQKKTLIAGIYGVPMSGSTVVVNSTGKLGVAASSARFKEAIKPIDRASEAVLALNPVSFRYKEDIDPDGIPQFGLIAEEVEKVNPHLVGRDEDGKANTVRYDAVNAMLLNEFLKEHRKVEEQQAMIGELKSAVAEQRKQIETLVGTVRNVSDRLELSKSVSQLLAND